MGDESRTGTTRKLDSREVPTATDRPSLTVYFSEGTAVSRTSWGRLKEHFR